MRKAMKREIYLDNSATTRPFDEVTDTISHINRYQYGNPSSLHTRGIEAEKLIKKARDTVAATLGVESREIVFTSGGTESNNLAIRGYLEANPRKGRHIITTAVEHPSVLEVFKYLSISGYKVDFLGVDRQGRICMEELREKLNNDTAFISILLVNNETGAVQPIKEIAALKNSVNPDSCLHVDGVQAYGKLSLFPKNTGIDLLSVSSHKIHGPKGAGALYVNRNIKIKPILFGGGQEALLRSGTENVTGISGFGLAAEMIFRELQGNREKAGELKSIFIDALEKQLDRYEIISPQGASEYILNVSFANLRSEVLLHHLEVRGIFVSTGSACSSRKNVHSHVLKAMGLAAGCIEGAIRFSFSLFNTKEDVLETVAALREIVPKIRTRK
jgi:cysteine desulfurase